MFSGFGMWEMILVFLVVLLLFGAKRLPEIGSSLGKGIREFKGSLREIEGELKLPDDERDPPRKVSRDRSEGEEGPRKLSSSTTSPPPRSEQARSEPVRSEQARSEDARSEEARSEEARSEEARSQTAS